MFDRFKAKLSAKHILIIVLLLVHIAPIWIFTYFPTQDGENHVYNAYVLKELHKHENYRLREVFKLNLTLFPNWTSHIFMTLLMYVFPPIVCEKIFLTFCIVLMPLSLFYFLSVVNRDKMIFGLLGFIYAFHYLLHMGFYSFALSVPMFFFTLGYWWKHKDEMNAARIGALYILLLTTYFCHFQSYLEVVMSLSFFALASLLYSAFVKTWGHRKNDSETLWDSLKGFVNHLRPFLAFVGMMLPAYFITLSYSLSSTRGYGRTYKSFAELKTYLFDMRSLVAFRDEHIRIGHFILYLLAAAFLLTIWDRISAVLKSRKNAENDQRLWTKIINGEEQFLLMAVFLTVMFFKVPYHIHSGGAWINDRIHIYIFLILLPFLSVGFHRYIRHAMAAIIIVLSLWNLSYNAHTYYHLSKDVSDMVEATGMVDEHTTLTGRPGEWGGPSDRFGEMKYVHPFLHLGSLLCLNNGAAYLPNYEAENNYFAINFREKPSPADYVLIWRTEYHQIEKLEEDYTLIHSGRYNKLYRLKKAEPDEGMWDGRNVIEFDMQPEDGQTAPGHIPISADTRYIDGKYGWLTISEREDFRSESEIPEPYRDSVWGEEDGVFRVALPNGTYKVTCYFCPGDSEPQEVNLIANGDKVVKKLRMPEDGKPIEKSYTVTITDERLTQVIYTRGKRGYQRWGWNGCRIELIQ